VDSTSSTWKPDKQVLRWAWLSIAVLVFGGLGGPLMFVSPDLAAATIAVALPFWFISLIKLWLAIGRAREIPPKTQNQLKLSLIVMGPVPVLQILIFNYFPESNFSGLRRSP
jgi:hypothetical protein